MRGLMCALVAAAIATGGCHGGAENTKTTQSHETPAAATKVCLLRAGGHNVLRLAAPADAPIVAGEGTVNVMSRDGYVQFWLVNDARTVDEGAKRADKVVVSEFKNFKATNTTDLTVAGSPAKRLADTGLEADDNDPGTADVVVFTVGGRVFVACAHGESLRPSAQQLMMTMAQTAKAP